MTESGVVGVAGVRRQGAKKDSRVQAEKMTLGPSHYFDDPFSWSVRASQMSQPCFSRCFLSRAWASVTLSSLERKRRHSRVKEYLVSD